MKILLFTVFGIACGLSVAQACPCYPMGLRDALCSSGRTAMFMVKAEVVEETGPLLDTFSQQLLVGMPEEGQKQFISDNSYMRYTLAVKDIYRDGNITIQPTSVAETMLSPALCGVRLSMGKTYVISESWYESEEKQVVMYTNTCWYLHQFDADVDIKMPSCENYPYPAPTNSKRSQGHESPVHFAAPVNNKRAQGLGGPPKFNITKTLDAAKPALHPFRLVYLIRLGRSGGYRAPPPRLFFMGTKMFVEVF